MLKKLRVLFFIRKVKEQHIVYVRVTIRSRRSGDWSTGIKLPDPDQWNSKKQCCDTPPRHMQRAELVMINKKLMNINMDLNNIFTTLISQGRDPSAKDVRMAYTTPILGITLQDFAVRFLENRRALVRSGKLAPNTLKTYLSKNQTLTKYDTERISLSAVDKPWLKQYEYWLLTTMEFSLEHTKRQLGYIKQLVNDAVDEGILTRNQLEGYKFRKGRPNLPVFLTNAELERVEQYRCFSESTELARDLFIFQCYTGLAFADMQSLNYKLHVSEIHECLCISQPRTKTGELTFVPLANKALLIWEKYGFEFPEICLQTYNRKLKIIADDCGIPKNVTSHIGRKTFANLMLYAGISIECVSAMLGHGDIRVTQDHYVRVNAQKIIQEMVKVGLK